MNYNGVCRTAPATPGSVEYHKNLYMIVKKHKENIGFPYDLKNLSCCESFLP